MSKRMLIDATHSEEMRVAVVENNALVDFDFENFSKRPLKGNLYLGKIVRIEPSLQAAFVDYGGNRHGFLAFTEIHPDYFRIPVADRPRDEEPVEEEEAKEDKAPKDSSDEAVEETSEEEAQPKKSSENFNPYKAYKIQEVITSRQVVLVQVVKEERGNKGAALTTYVSLAGRYCVLMPNAIHGGGISRRITDMGDRRRLKQLIQDLDVPDNMSLIVRTAGLDRSKTEIKRDYGYLIKLWSQIRELTLKGTAPSLIYKEANLLRRAIRDLYIKEIEEVLVEGEEGYKEVKTFMKDMVPSHAKKVQRYKEEDYPLFYKHKIERQIEKMYSPEVQLRSGGYIVINPTEALVSIDVNSGKSTRERHIDTTALNTNLEAAEEIARQVRLRDLAGLIVIDFIDMTDSRHNHQVEKCLKEALAVDRARVQVGRISQFGLLEMSRQRLRPSIMEASTVTCPKCAGMGVVRSTESFALQLLRVLEEISLEDPEQKDLTVFIPSNIAFYLLIEKRHEISQLEERYKLQLSLREDEKLDSVGFRIESKGRFIIDGVGNTGKSENKSSQKEEGNAKKGSSSKKNQGNKPSKKKEAKDSQKESNDSQKSRKDTQNQEEKKDAKPQGGRRGNLRRRRRRPEGDASEQGQKQEKAGPSAGENKPQDNAPQQSATEGKKKPSKDSAHKSQPASAGAPPAKAPAGKGRGKKGWWQRLLDS